MLFRILDDILLNVSPDDLLFRIAEANIQICHIGLGEMLQHYVLSCGAYIRKPGILVKAVCRHAFYGAAYGFGDIVC